MMGGSTTGVADVLATLHEGLPTKLPDGVVLVKGDRPGEQPNDALVVASSDPDMPGVVVTYGPLPNRQPAEQIEVSLIARSYAGDEDMDARVARCAAIFAGVQDYVRESARVENRWDQIEIGPNALWHPVYTERGCNCFVGFSLVCTRLL